MQVGVKIMNDYVTLLYQFGFWRFTLIFTAVVSAARGNLITAGIVLASAFMAYPECFTQP
jgi:uncharacterized integral membrane protein